MLLVVFPVGAMKKYLPALAALALAGCAHSQYRATYLQEYAGYDCRELRTERLDVEAELDPRWRKGYSSTNTVNSVAFFAAPSVHFPFGVYETLPPDIAVDPAKVRRQKKRMRNHARWQALVQLEQNKGCRR